MFKHSQSQQQLSNRFNFISNNFDSSSKIILTINGGGNTEQNLIATLWALFEKNASALHFFGEMLEHAHDWEYIRISQKKLGIYTGLDRTTINIFLGYIKDFGLMGYGKEFGYKPSFGTRPNKVCDYQINELFLVPHIRYLLSQWFPVLRTALPTVQKKNPTLLRSKEIHSKPTSKTIFIFDNLKQYPAHFWKPNFEPPPEG